MEGTDAALITNMSGGDGVGFTEHYAKRIIIGDLENTRAGLKSALEKLGYFVENGQPLIIAKRKTKLSGDEKKIIVKRLQISLTSANEISTVANFSYAIMNSALTKGDRKTIEAEIDALAALTTSRQLQTACAACGTGNTNDSRFCRVCGVPNTVAEPAELEVLRLTANARSAHQMIVGGAIFTFCWLVVSLLLSLLPKMTGLAAVLIFGGGALLGILWSFYGIIRLHRTLNSPAKVRENLPAEQTDFLTPPARISVTEGTTELLQIQNGEGHKTKEF
jgi:RNA polymerase subunit RPABC4/transcription elongation factor Spt4